MVEANKVPTYISEYVAFFVAGLNLQSAMVSLHRQLNEQFNSKLYTLFLATTS